jgi:uncharacterized membrane protein YdbT with pleckstrin-like domain
MFYSNDKLLSGEKILYNASIYGDYYYLAHILNFCLLLFAFPFYDHIQIFNPFSIFIFQEILIIYLLIRASKTKLYITDNRVLGQSGLIFFNSKAICLNKINYIVVVKSILGKFLNYGVVKIYTSSATIAFNCIENPEGFRQTLFRAIESDRFRR